MWTQVAPWRGLGAWLAAGSFAALAFVYTEAKADLLPPAPDIRCVSKTASVSELAEGQDTDVTYTVTISNGGGSAAEGVTITDVLPGELCGADVLFDDTNSSTGCKDNLNGTVTCNVGSVGGGSSTLQDIAVTILNPGESAVCVNTASVASNNDSNPNNNGGPGSSCEVTLNVVAGPPEADLQCLSKTVDKATITAGEATTLSYVVTVKNNGPDPATGISIEDTLPAGVTFSSGNTDWTCAQAGAVVTCTQKAGSLAAGATDSVTIVVNVPAATAVDGAELVNSAEVTPGTEPDNTPDNNGGPGSACEARTTVEAGGGDEGCTPGFWRNHLADWAATGFSLGDDFDTTFGVALFSPDITLQTAVNLGGGGVKKLARHGTAAVLSAAHPNVDYPYTVAEVIAFVQAGNVNPLVAANELGCDLSD